MGRRSASRLPRTNDRQHLLARLIELNTKAAQHLRGNALPLGNETEQKVFGSHVRVVQVSRLLHRELEHSLRSRGVREIWPARGLRSATFQSTLHSLSGHPKID